MNAIKHSNRQVGWPLDFSKLFYRPPAIDGVAIRQRETQNHGLEKALDHELIAKAAAALAAKKPVAIESRIFNAMLQSAASKHAATQKAMKSASDNADKLIRDYTRLANNARQSEITQQISEIVGGADALSSANK